MRLSLKAAAVAVSTLGAMGAMIGPAGAAPATEVAEKASVTAASCYAYNRSGTTLNVRSGAGTSYSVVGTIAAGGRLPCGSLGEGSANGQTYTACGGTDNDWKTVRINGRDGWVAAECVALGA
ncbi:SH3 domain-containing protein [Streptomyces phaeochromogenes]|uniref:SH3 domain-containing protein n=1 Tax=Streptomyces phaeochromogenes TaxID=1923 RepID=UPI002DDAA2CC|nr:SH3 domain-containing protein [Streptomyces phaeochromogenes]WRZ30244.1 SH3 domain-containing protein [Streptomyces phaeochromogenes]WSW16683.1 SH3 domain-containing protein [Streptomyces phaeochromogenes]WTA04860.1 SH3 domain-containing protein [Streptomyces phaeochromogenes]